MLDTWEMRVDLCDYCIARLRMRSAIGRLMSDDLMSEDMEDYLLFHNWYLNKDIEAK